MSLKSRLLFAFVILIVTSASATIFIGDRVFGSKVVELAGSRMEVALGLAEMILSERLDEMKLLVTYVSHLEPDSRAMRETAADALRDEPFLDFGLLVTSDRAELLLRGGSAGRPVILTPENRRHLERCPLWRLAGEAGERGRGLASMLVLGDEDMRALGYEDPPAYGLFMVGVNALPDGGWFLVGGKLNRRMELVARAVENLSPHHGGRYAASLFLGNRRVASTFGPEAIGTEADPTVRKAVMEEGRTHVGSADVIGHNYYAAYSALRDYWGAPIGILGIGAAEEIYSDVRSRTITLFGSLIAAGMIFGFIMTFWFSAWIIRPIRELGKGMNRVADGDLNYKVRISSVDELGRLARAFNKMVRNVRDRDIELRKMTDERLSQVEKQVSIGRLAAGVAHEINNPLTSILSLSMLMRKHLPEDDDRREDLDIIVTETTRCRDIVRGLLDFARERPPETQLIDLNEVIRNTLTLASHYEAMDHVRTDLRLAEGPLLVDGDPKQLQQVFTNLITNSAEATDTGGWIDISSDEDSSGEYIVVTLRDNGKGMTKDQLERAFEPFFTTKGQRKGTGLGLSVTLGIIRRHDGSIDIDSERGKGTTVTMYLPRFVRKGEQP